ncbi:uncharacterized protein (TIGR02246 family) [Paenarthrobacter nicotinovorans]|uniref:nuclear transport factor 2 family protein n=1 Tax=Micrococcaceae TaxID=1268 RepID=UPI000876CD41|nr:MULTISPECIES: nuclear transport factor 2 family protein [Micrococcaceae]MDR6438735.1 uncharacterized protein (TIGR02246 family) [Paenarthrobacter nicotinovorans]SCZ56443.1 conserved hypothetical protein [Arthrobacter sp. UNCCL28]
MSTEVNENRTTSPSIEELTRRLVRLEDVQAIEKLKYTYAGYCDDSYNPEGIAALFVEDGRWIVDGEGATLVGHDAIRGHFTALSERIPWALHFVMAPNIVVAEDGLSAKGTFYLLCLCTIEQTEDPSKKDAVVLTVTYSDKFVKRDGTWFFEELIGRTHQVSNWDKGWVEQQFRD